MSTRPLHRIVTAIKPHIQWAITTLVWEPDRRRARAPWRILVPLIPALLIPRLFGPLFVGEIPVPAIFFLVNVVSVIVTITAVGASIRYLDRGRSLREYGLVVHRRWIADLSAGIVAGLAGVTIPVLGGIAVGIFDIAALFDRGVMAFWPGLVLIVLAYLCVGLAEELLYRGIVLTNAIEGLHGAISKPWAVAGGLLVSALVFALPHAAQPSHPAYLVTWLLAGVVLGFLYLLSGDLALPMGVHVALNTGLSGLFVRTDLAVAGNLSAIVRLDPTIQSPLFDYGGLIEGSAFLMAGMFAGLWLWYSRDSRANLFTYPISSVAGSEKSS